ncbi:MAG: Uma2 family endonuclease [Planctomycetales bacterium]
MADLAKRFGAMPCWRLRHQPAPGTATETDLVRLLDRDHVACELVAGILVEKTVGAEESRLAALLCTLLNTFVRPRKLGVVFAPDAPVRLRPGLVRIPDVCFIASNRLPGGKYPRTAILDIVPNLIIEVLSRSNTRQEMRQKLREYFQAGVELVWYVNPPTRTAEVFSSANQSTVLLESQSLSGGDLLPGFKLKLRELFADLDEQ